MLARVGTYGRQIGQIGDAVGVLVSLIDEDKRAKLAPEQQQMLVRLEDQLKLVGVVKEERRLEKKMGRDGSAEDGARLVPPSAPTALPAGASLS
jgi:hypothetical protein